MYRDLYHQISTLKQCSAIYVPHVLRSHQELPSPSGGGSPGLLGGGSVRPYQPCPQRFSWRRPRPAGGWSGVHPTSGVRGTGQSEEPSSVWRLSVKLGPRGLFSQALRAGPQSALSLVVRSPASYTSHPCDLQALIPCGLCGGHPRLALPVHLENARRGSWFPHGSFEVRENRQSTCSGLCSAEHRT